MDARALSEEKIIPPEPLPFVSRRCLKKVKDSLSPPSTCPYCGGSVKLSTHKEIYGKDYSDWPFAYICKPCDAYVGLHPKTDLPLGTLAKKELRQARSKYKPLFFGVIKAKKMSISEGYDWLSIKMDLKKELCHWGLFDEFQCKKAGEICKAEIKKC